MTTIELKKGEHLVRKGEASKEIYIVVKGSLDMMTAYNRITLESGSVVGISLGIADEYICDYVAAEDVLIASYRYESPLDYKVIFDEQPGYCYAFLHAAIKQYKIILDNYMALQDAVDELTDFIALQYSEYEFMCQQVGAEQNDAEIEELYRVYKPEPIKEWEFGYFQQLCEMPEKNLKYFYADKQDLTIGVLLQIADVLRRMISNMDSMQQYVQRAKDTLICEESDLLELWRDLAIKLVYMGETTEQTDAKVKELENFLKRTGFYTAEEIEDRIAYYTETDFVHYLEKHKVVIEDEENEDGEVAEELTREEVLKTDFTSYIMKYASYDDTEIQNTKQLIAEYKKIAEIQDYTPEMQKVRKMFTKVFYEIYEKAFFRAVHARSISVVMKLFFNFGVLDLQLAGTQHLDELMAVSQLLDNQFIDQKERSKAGENFCHVYTTYQWLRAIYRGEKEPSKNEFDVDYAGHLLDQRKRKEITREEEHTLKHDQKKKVQFEIQNMFMSNNRITYGRISTFCPVLHSKDFIRSVDQLIVSDITVNAAIDNLRELDYSCFYREVFFAAPKYGIERTEIMKEVLPDVILMPNIGSKAMMWQETAGVKKDTPARFIFPVMTVSDMPDMMLETVGRYRWEICRKILGVRWNDIRDKSLTSEFYDYVQFYRKNRELSQQAKEKVKADLIHAKNNYREVFVSDYIGWMKYESQGNFRLNKVSRRIFAEYVPFQEDVRKKLEENPMYKELFARTNILNARKREKEKILFERYVAAGGVITPELRAHLEFYGVRI